MSRVWEVLHLFFAFSFVGSLVVAEWNGRAARAAGQWEQRALLFRIVHLSSRVAGLGSLVLAGVFGNLASIAGGYSMASDVWLRWVNGLWLAAVLVMALVTVPHSGRLAAVASLAAGGGAADGYARSLARWRFGSMVLSILYLALLTLMVFHWRS